MGGNNRSGRYPGGALTEVSTEGQRLSLVEEAFASLPERYLGANHDFAASYRIELDDLGISWAVELDEKSCRVTVSPERDPDVVIGRPVVGSRRNEAVSGERDLILRNLIALR